MAKKAICPNCGKKCVKVTRYANGSILAIHTLKPCFGGLMLDANDSCLIPSPYGNKERITRNHAQRIKTIGYVNARDMNREDLYRQMGKAGYRWDTSGQFWARTARAV